MAGAQQLHESVLRGAPPVSDARIELDDVAVRRGRRTVLDGCSVVLDPGISVVVGGNGAGKSTLLGCVAGLVPPSAGRVTVAGAVVPRDGLTREQGRHLGYLPQEPRLPGHLTVAQAIDYSRWLHRARVGDRPAFATADLAARLGLAGVVDRRLGELSGGMNRLAMIAVASVHRPAVLLLDEATAGVDIEHRATFRAFLDELRSTTTIVLSSHVSADVEHLADRVLVLANGRIAYDGTPSELDDLGAGDRGHHESGAEAALRRLTSRGAA